MRHILIATHGTMADGLKKSVELICGTQANLTCMNFYSGDADCNRFLADYMDALGNGDELVVCTDIFFGSVNQKFLPYLSRPGMYVLTGVNLPAVLEVVMYDGPLTSQALEKIAHLGREQLYMVRREELTVGSDENFI